MIKIDLHTHSEASRDGGITPNQYAKILEEETLDVIAITDHDRIDFAQGLQQALGRERIIVGEEITTKDGEIIGLYLTEVVPPQMTAQDTVDAIKAQNGLVYIPHPFEKVRKGIQKDILEAIIEDVDIIEGYNGRALSQKFSPQATAFAKIHGIPSVASSDAHGVSGIGKSHTNLQNRPTRQSLLIELQSSFMICARPPWISFLLPTFNRYMNRLRGKNYG